MPTSILAHKLLLPELRLRVVKWKRGKGDLNLFVDKHSEVEVCPKCATPSQSVYDRREIRVKDQPVHGKLVRLWVRKRRFSCKPCGRPFTEPVPGIKKGHRTTQRYRAGVLWACENFSDLSAVRRAYRCSSGTLYKALYEQLELRRRRRLCPWPKVVGIDEHFFRRAKGGFPAFVSVIADYDRKRLLEVVDGKTTAGLEVALASIPERENVRYVVCDLADPFKNFARGFFPNAAVIADKFHVLRLLSPALNRRRKAITGDRRSLPVRRVLLRSGATLKPIERFVLAQWLEKYPELAEVYRTKEALHALYRTRGTDRAAAALTRLTDHMAHSTLPEIATLRRTLIKWRTEILAYFGTGLTNGRTEGFNNKAKLVKRRAYGYRSFRNYRLRLLNACA